MKKGLKIGLNVFVLLLIALALWFFRPWTDYSPYKIVSYRSSHTEAQWFANFHKVLPSRRIAPSESPRQWPRATRDVNITYQWEGEQKTLHDYMTQTGVTGFMVLQDGAIAFEHYANGSEAETRNMVWSVAKSYTVTLLGLALKEGVIKSLDDTVETYAPRFKGTAYGETSIRHIAMMSSRINFGPDDKWGPFQLWAKTYFDLTWRQLDMDDVAADMDRLTPPGVEFRYRFPDTHVISAVLRAAYADSYGGKVSWAQLVEDKLWKPFGFGGEAFWVISPAGELGTSWGHAGVSMRLLELAQLGQIYLENGVPYGIQEGEAGGQSRFPEEWLDGVSKPNAPFQEPAADSYYPDQGYSRQFWIPQDYDGEFMALGGFDQVVWIDLKRNAVIAQTAARHRHGGVSPLEQFKVFRAVVTASSAGSSAGPNDDIDQVLDHLLVSFDAADAEPDLYPSQLPERPGGALDASSVAQALAHFPPENAIVVDEAVTTGMAIGPATLTARPHDWLNLTGGSIGWGFPGAVGAAVACPDRKVDCLEGDGQSWPTFYRRNNTYPVLNLEYLWFD